MSAPAALPALPFSQDTADALFRLTQGLEPAGLWWLSGYAAGLATRGTAVASAPDAAPGAEAAEGAPGGKGVVAGESLSEPSIPERSA